MATPHDVPPPGVATFRATAMQFWIRNTSRYPDAEVERLVLFGSEGIDMSRVCVNVRNGALAGGAYNGVPSISNAPRAARYLITLRVGTGRERWPLGPVNYHFKSPDEVGPRNRFPFYTCADWREWLVKLSAHEAHHIKQFRAKATCSEIECEHFSVAALQRFRQLEGRMPVTPAPLEAQISARARRAGWGDEPRPRPSTDEASPAMNSEPGQIALF